MPKRARRFPFGSLLALLIAGLLVAACAEETESPPPPQLKEVLPLAPGAVQPSAANLILGSTHVEPFDEASQTYQIVATIENTGGSDASAFSAGCTYKCPPGGSITGGGLDIVQGGVIAGNSSYTYKSPFHLACESKPPTLGLTCSITSAQGGTQTYAVNVTLP